MTLDEFRSSLSSTAPPDGQGGPLQALWHAANGAWHKAHELVMDDDSADAAWVHAYLHRVEGDESNAGYWYRRAGKPLARDSLDDEWSEIAAALLLRT
jgi:hypothetical protein